MAGPVLAYQLIYTNVEADLSPARQRGFQVWLASPELTPDQRRHTAKRLDDFRLPPGSTPQDASLARHVFFRLPDNGLFVIARTVPSAERDKFGRGGKFHAHAVLVNEDGFRALGCDPFRVIDGGFRFHSTPAEAMAADGWRSGELRQVEIHPAKPASDLRNLPTERLIELIDHIERADEKPVVIADRPDHVLALLRGCFALFPPCVRRRAEFDTLSTGASLAQIRYPVVGAFSADNLKTWSFRRYHRLDLANGTCTPPLLAPAAALSCELVPSAGWQQLNDTEREAVFVTARTLTNRQLDELRTDGLSPAAVAVLTRCAGFRPSLEAAIQSRIGRDVHAALARLPEVSAEVTKHFAGPPVETLERLREPVPREVIAHALYDALGRSHVPPDHDTLAGLGEWLAAGKPPPRLELIFRRWRGSDADIARIERFLAEPGDDDKRHQWFREWLAATLATDPVEDLIARLQPDRSPAPLAIRDARLWLALYPEPTPAWVELRLLTALQRGPEALAAVLNGPARPEGADGWLLRVIATRMRDRFRAGWMNDGLGGIVLGLFLVPDRPTDETLLDAALGLGSQVARRLLLTLWPIVLRPEAIAAPADTEPPPPEKANGLYRKVWEADPKSLAGGTRDLREYLIVADDEAYAWVGNQFLRKAYGEPVLRAITDDVYFVGLKLVWVQFDKPSHQLAVFEAVAGAVVPEVSDGSVPEVGRGLEPRPARRFTWLLSRLTDPNGTERLRV